MKKILLTGFILLNCCIYANANENYDLNEIKIEKLEIISIKEELDLEMKKMNKEMNDKVMNEIKINKLNLKQDLISKKKTRTC